MLVAVGIKHHCIRRKQSYIQFDPIVFHIGQYNEANAFWSRSLFVDPNGRSARVPQNNERICPNLGPVPTLELVDVFIYVEMQQHSAGKTF